MSIPLLMMEHPLVFGPSHITRDVLKKTCLVTTFLPGKQWKKVDVRPERYFTPDNLAVISTR